MFRTEVLPRALRAVALSVLSGFVVGGVFLMLEFNGTYYDMYGHSETNAVVSGLILLPFWFLTPLPEGRLGHYLAFVRGLPLALLAILWDRILVDAVDRAHAADPWFFSLLIFVPIWLVGVPLRTWQWLLAGRGPDVSS